MASNPYTGFNPLGAGLAQVPEAYQKGQDVQAQLDAQQAQREQQAKTAELQQQSYGLGIQQTQQQMAQDQAYQDALKQAGPTINTPEGYTKFGQQLAAVGHPKALEAMQMAQKMQQDALLKHSSNAMAYAISGDTTSAQSALDEFAKLDPNKRQMKFLPNETDEEGDPVYVLQTKNPDGTTQNTKMDSHQAMLWANRDLKAYNEYTQNKEEWEAKLQKEAAPGKTELTTLQQQRQNLEDQGKVGNREWKDIDKKISLITTNSLDALQTSYNKPSLNPSKPLPDSLEDRALNQYFNGIPMTYSVRDPYGPSVGSRLLYFQANPDAAKAALAARAGARGGENAPNMRAQAQQIAENKKTAESFGGGGYNATRVDSANTFAQHLTDFWEAFKQTNPNGVPSVNRLAEMYKQITGRNADTSLAPATLMRSIVSGELEQLVSKKAITVAERENIDKNMPMDMNIHGMRSIVKQLAKAAAGRLISADADYYNLYGKHLDEAGKLQDTAANLFNKFNINYRSQTSNGRPQNQMSDSVNFTSNVDMYDDIVDQKGNIMRVVLPAGKPNIASNWRKYEETVVNPGRAGK